MGGTDLNAEQEEVQVEVDSRENVFVRNRHQNGRTTVCENSRNGVLCY